MMMVAATRPTIVGVAARIAVLLFIFGLAECAAGSCLSYGHSCWGAHGKRNGGNSSPPEPEEVPVPQGGSSNVGSDGQDTRWFLSKLLQQADPATRSKLWQRIISARSTTTTNDRRYNNVLEDEELRENEADLSRSRGLHLDGSEEAQAGILLPESGEFAGEENQDAEVVIMADDQPERSVPKKLRVFKIMSHNGRKLDK